MAAPALRKSLRELAAVVEAAQRPDASAPIPEAEVVELRTNFPAYAERCLKIRTKEGPLVSLKLNRAQRFIHKRLEDQLAKTGKVRAMILKGRQQGCSTYIEGRFYWKVTQREGAQAFILTHHTDATNNLFDMAARFHEHCPAPLKPDTGAANAKELYFNTIDSGYKVGTAGTKEIGRSATIQLFHGSEVAMWENAESHAAGALQAVPGADDTEVVLESTARGMGGLFHTKWVEAERGDSEYIAIFVPWYWQEEYSVPVPESFKADPDELDYKETYGLTDGQLAWRRLKIKELGSLSKFRQEYPADAVEAFQDATIDRFITGHTVTVARVADLSKERFVPRTEPILIGVDVARRGKDKTVICIRQGREVLWMEAYGDINPVQAEEFDKADILTGPHRDTMQTANRVKRIIRGFENEGHSTILVYVDDTGVGGGVTDKLIHDGYSDHINAVNFGSTPVMYPERYVNRRAEMWGRMRDWLEAQPAKIPDCNALHADLTGPSFDFDAYERLRLESKDKMRERGVPSPDFADALALTFADLVLPSAWRGKLDYGKIIKGIV